MRSSFRVIFRFTQLREEAGEKSIGVAHRRAWPISLDTPIRSTQIGRTKNFLSSSDADRFHRVSLQTRDVDCTNSVGKYYFCETIVAIEKSLFRGYVRSVNTKLESRKRNDKGEKNKRNL